MMQRAAEAAQYYFALVACFCVVSIIILASNKLPCFLCGGGFKRRRNYRSDVFANELGRVDNAPKATVGMGENSNRSLWIGAFKSDRTLQAALTLRDDNRKVPLD